MWFFKVYLDHSFFIFMIQIFSDLLYQPSLSPLSELYQYSSFQVLCMWAHFVNIICLYPTLSKIPQGFPKVACSLLSLFEHACSSMKFYVLSVCLSSSQKLCGACLLEHSVSPSVSLALSPYFRQGPRLVLGLDNMIKPLTLLLWALENQNDLIFGQQLFICCWLNSQ